MENQNKCSLTYFGTFDIFQHMTGSILISHLLKDCIVRKPASFKYENKDADQLCSSYTADQHLCFGFTDIWIVQPLFFLKIWNVKLLHVVLFLNRLVCVRHGQKP